MHTPAQHLVAYRHIPLFHCVVTAKVTSNAVALATPSRVSDSLPDSCDVYSHGFGVEYATLAWLVDELEWSFRLVSIADTVTEVHVNGASNRGATEDKVVEVLAEFGGEEFLAFFDGAVELRDCVLS